MGKFIDLTGQKFGRLTVIERAENDKRGKSRWLCQCECGNKSIVAQNHLRNGETKSCGCLARKMVSQRFRTHGERHHRLYHIFSNMKERCRNPNHKSYKDYGGRGITVCEEWQTSFEAFRDWAMANGYADNLSIDRIDNNKGYCPENCRWVSMKEQQRNTRKTCFIEYDGKTQSLSDWAEQMGIERKTLLYRISSGWSVERALNTPVDTRKYHKRK